MKLMTHNLLTSKIIGKVQNGYPLKLTVYEINESVMDFSPIFIARIVPRLNWDVLVEAVKSVSEVPVTTPLEIPTELPEDYEKDESFLKKLHHCIMEVEVLTGVLECPETGRKFNITNGIPNMLVNEDEV